jgi:hypothetical protein
VTPHCHHKSVCLSEFVSRSSVLLREQSVTLADFRHFNVVLEGGSAISSVSCLMRSRFSIFKLCLKFCLLSVSSLMRSRTFDTSTLCLKFCFFPRELSYALADLRHFKAMLEVLASFP